jgi:hypothetical protein
MHQHPKMIDVCIFWKHQEYELKNIQEHMGFGYPLKRSPPIEVFIAIRPYDESAHDQLAIFISKRKVWNRHGVTKIIATEKL